MDIGTRPLCKKCNDKPRAYGYKRNGKVYWRSKWDTCIRKEKNLKVGGITPLQRSGYKLKNKCELCGFKAVEKSQMNVYFVDGNKKNVNPINLKTVCANCQRLTSVKRLGWRMGDLQADD